MIYTKNSPLKLLLGGEIFYEEIELSDEDLGTAAAQIKNRLRRSIPSLGSVTAKPI